MGIKRRTRESVAEASLELRCLGSGLRNSKVEIANILTKLHLPHDGRQHPNEEPEQADPGSWASNLERSFGDDTGELDAAHREGG